MYEEYYAPIPDLDAVLKRIKVSRPARLDLDALNTLIYQFQCNVPFEDISCSRLHTPVLLDTQSLYDKIIVQNRGGFCFEMNGFFALFLKGLGFDARSVFCRIIRGRDFIPACRHRAIIVNIKNQLYFCDVGYGGPMPAGALPLQDGCQALIHGELFHIHQFDEYWWTLSRTTSAGEFEKVLQFNTFPQSPLEFLAVNKDCSEDPESIFVQKLLVNLRTENGSFSLTDDELTIREGEKTTVRKLADNRECEEVLKEYFGICVSLP